MTTKTEVVVQPRRVIVLDGVEHASGAKIKLAEDHADTAISGGHAILASAYIPADYTAGADVGPTVRLELTSAAA